MAQNGTRERDTFGAKHPAFPAYLPISSHAKPRFQPKSTFKAPAPTLATHRMPGITAPFAQGGKVFPSADRNAL